MALGSVESQDAGLLDACKHQQPINHNCTSQLQRANKAKKQEAEEDEAQPQKIKAASKAKAKAKTKAKAKAQAKTLPKAQAKHRAKETPNPSKDAASETHEEHSGQQMASTKEEPVKTKGGGNGKSAKKMSFANKGIKKKKKLKKQGKRKKTAPENKDKCEHEDKTDELPAGLDPKASRAINRKRFTSRAWHKAFQASKAEGLDPEQAKAKARIASQAASAEFVQLWPSNGTVFDLH